MFNLKSLRTITSWLLISVGVISCGDGGSYTDSPNVPESTSVSTKLSGVVALATPLSVDDKLQVVIAPDSTTSVAGAKSGELYDTSEGDGQVVSKLAGAVIVPVAPDGSFNVSVPAGTNYSAGVVRLSGSVAQKVETSIYSGGVLLDDISVSLGEDKYISVAEDDFQPAGTVTFMVSDKRSGEGVSGGLVRALRLDEIFPIDSLDGSVSLAGLLPGKHILLIEHDGYADATIEFQLSPGEDKDLGVVLLDADVGDVVGQVEADGLDNLSGMVVYLRGSDNSIYSVFTNDAGTFRFDDIPVADGYTVIVSANGFNSEKIEGVNVNQGSITPISTVYMNKVDGAAAGSITGFARFAERDEFQHSGIVVSIEGTDKEAITSRDGAYIFNDIPAGTYVLNFTDSIHQSQTLQEVVVVDWASTKLPPITLASVNGGLSGTVLDSAGTALSGATVSVVEAGVSTNSEPTTGDFTISSLPVGTYQLRISKEGYSSEVVSVSVEANIVAALPRPITLTPNSFSGTISLGSGITDHSGVSVTLEGASTHSTLTDGTGAFTIIGAPSGNYQLNISKESYKTQSVAVYIPADQVAYTLPYTVEMTLNYGTLNGQVFLQNAINHSGTLVTVIGTSYTTQTDTSGNWTMSLPEGSYSGGLLYSHSDFVSQSDANTITITADQTTLSSSVTLSRDTGSVTGVVTDSSANPLSGVTISDALTGASTTTDGAGAFTLANVAVGTHDLVASVGGHESATVSVTVSSGVTTDISTTPIVLTPYTFSGTISLGADVTDHSGATILLEGTSTHSAVSDVDGNFSISGAASGNYQLNISKSGYKTQSVAVYIPVDQAAYTLPFTVEMQVSYGLLSGKVSLQGATDHSGTTVSVSGTSYTTQTDTSGNWTMSLPEGSYSGGLLYSHSDFVSQSDANTITITADQTTLSSSVTLSRDTGSVTGVVTDSSANPLSGVTISDALTGASTTTDGAGAFTLANVAVGTHDLVASVGGHVDGTVSVTVSSGLTTDISATPIALTPYTFSGTISLGADVTDHSGATILLEGTSTHSAVSAADGSFSISGAASGNYQLNISKSGYKTQSVAVYIPADQAAYTLPFTVEMQVSYGLLSGKVSLQGTTDHSGTTVSVSGTSYTTQTDTSGNWTMSLPEGSYSGGLLYSHSDFISQSDSSVITITADQTTLSSSITLSRDTGSVTGVVTDSSANPLSGVTVSDALTGASTTTDGAGAFTLANVAVGTHDLVASVGGHVDGTVSVTVSSGLTTDISATPIALTPYSFSGTISLGADVTDHSGVLVTLEGGDTYVTTSNVDGSFTISGAVAGNYQVHMSASGYKTQTLAVVVQSTDVNYELPYVVVMDRQVGVIRGIATLENQTDHSGTVITLDGTSYSAVTNSLGEWVMSVPIGNYTGLTYSKSLYTTINQVTTLTVSEFGENVVSAVSLVQEAAALTISASAVNDCSVLSATVEGIGGAAVGYYGVFEVPVSGVLDIASVPLGEYSVSISCVDAGWETYVSITTVDASALSYSLEPVVLRQSYVKINDDSQYTNNATVTLAIGNTDAVLMQVLEGVTDTGWIPYSSAYTLALNAGDGEKIVTVNFKDSLGQVLPAVQDSIVLDTTLNLAAPVVTGNGTYGGVLHFSVDAGEIGGEATVSLPGLVDGLSLYDNGLLGDAAANDGVYEVDYTITTSIDVSEYASATFVDVAGNTSTVSGASPVVVSTASTILNVTTASNVNDGIMVFQFVTDELVTAQLAYGLSFDAMDTVVDVSTSLATSHSVEITGLAANDEVFFEIRATDQGSNLSTYQGQSLLAPPAPHGLVINQGDNEIGLAWSLEPGGYTLSGFDVYRSNDGFAFNKLNSSVISNHFYIDAAAVNGATYYYKVVAVDVYGNESGESSVIQGAADVTYSGPTTINDALVSSNQVWISSKSPYILETSVLVETGNTLFVTPGTELRFASGMYLKIEGTLVAQGLVGDEITFTSNSALPAVSDWGGIWFNSSDVHMNEMLVDGVSVTVDSSSNYDASQNYIYGSVIENVNISYAASGVTVQETSVFISDSVFSYNNHGVELVNTTRGGVIRNSEFVSNSGSGVKISNATSGGITIEYYDVSGNLFGSNGAAGLVLGGVQYI